MEFLSSIVGTVAGFTVVPIGRQASYLIFYKGNFSMLAVHIKDLEAAKERITHSVEQEKRNGKNIESDVVNWLEEVDEVIKKANLLQNDPRRANARCSAWPFPNLILRHQLSRKATKIVKDVIQVQGKGMFDRVGFLPPIHGEASSSSTRVGEKYETRESLKENIMNALAQHNSCNIGVYGLGGVGKTTLVGEVFEISKKHKLFDVVVKTHVSETPDIKKIQGEIADLLGLRFDEETILGRAHRLRQRIKMEKNILIILDNIWTILDLEKVGIPFGNEHNGCKLLMTSRNQDVLLQMDVPKDFIFKLELMSENETWSLFQFMAGDVVKDSNLKGIAIQVAQKCAGLPLSIVAVAQALKGKRDIHSWKDALKRLESGHHTVFSALELSYDSLESDEMKDIFLLFAVMSGNDVRYFLKVAMGLGILKHINTVDDARNRLYSVIHSLKATCLLLEVKTSGIIEMHDFVGDFAISIALRDKHVFLRKQSDEERPTKDFLKRCTQVILGMWYMHELPQMIDCPNIKLFHLNDKNRSLEIPDNYFEGMGSLKVLDLTSLNLSSLPTSFRFLTDLQTLCLNFCILENMVEIEALKNLVILCLGGSSMTKLPREIGQLTQLRMLDLSHSGIEVIPPNILSSLTKMEELYMGNTFVNWEDEIVLRDNSSSASTIFRFRSLTLEHLETLQNFFSRSEQKHQGLEPSVSTPLFNDQVEFPDLDTLKLSSLNLNKIWNDNHHSMCNLTSLIVESCGELKYLFLSTMVGSFKNLKQLEISNCPLMEEIIAKKERNNEVEEVHFFKLEKITLKDMDNLNTIWHRQFETVKMLQVSNCKKIVVVFPSSMQNTYSKLEMLEVTDCDLVEKIFELGFNENSSVENTTHLKIVIDGLPELKNIWSGDLHSILSFQILIVVSLTNCANLEYLLPLSIATRCSHLTALHIKQCGNMKEIVAEEKESRVSAAPTFEFNQLSSLLLWNLHKLKGFYAKEHTVACSSLKDIDVFNCAKLNLYTTLSSRSSNFQDDKLSIVTPQPPFIVEEVISQPVNIFEFLKSLPWQSAVIANHLLHCTIHIPNHINIYAPVLTLCTDVSRCWSPYFG
ncbi:hypothetical protein TSUD_414670 [Trifolium subterraneum]|uniref:Uncharacterized protein n=1 Tax=Trifolium subterraneum TaxID=3900 RepID=A0A2Z6PL35_TRISU|nr:hypothetical protein TSUD_414670 [Trifolium subterraneum]